MLNDSLSDPHELRHRHRPPGEPQQHRFYLMPVVEPRKSLARYRAAQTIAIASKDIAVLCLDLEGWGYLWLLVSLQQGKLID